MTNSLSTPADPRMYQFPVSGGQQAETFRVQQTPESVRLVPEATATRTEVDPDFLVEPGTTEAEFRQAQYAQRLTEPAPSAPEIEAARSDVQRHVDAAQERQSPVSTPQSAERAVYIDPVEYSTLAKQWGAVLREHRNIAVGIAPVTPTVPVAQSQKRADFELAA